MNKKDTNSISYIFNEMDPSEEVEFERELELNNNLLIEVETLKNTKERLQNLPDVNPPAHLVQSVRMMAAKKASDSRRRKQFSVYSAAAAVLLMAFASGFFIYDNEHSSENAPAEQAGMAGSAEFQNVMSPADQPEELTPWVDQNEIIRFTDQFQRENQASFDTVFKHSFQKLTPVTDPVQSRIYRRELQLTGSN